MFAHHHDGSFIVATIIVVGATDIAGLERMSDGARGDRRPGVERAGQVA